MRLQGDASVAWRTLETTLRQSTAILTPTNGGMPSDVLVGCENFDLRSGTLAPALPVTSFMFCESAGKLYYHRISPSTCPATALPSCADPSALMLADNVSHLPGTSAYFSRPSSGLIRFTYQTSASAAAQPIDVTVAYNAAAGANQ